MNARVKRSLSIVLSVCFIICLSIGLAAGEPPTEITQAARQGVAQFLKPNDLPGGFPLGDAEISDWRAAEIGHGFQVYTINPQALVNDRDVTLHAMIIPTGVWRFVLNVKGNAALLVTVVHVDGKWRAVSFGGALLAKEVQTVSAQWPAQKGYETRFVRVFQAKADLIEINKGPQAKGFVPLRSAKLSLNMEYRDTKPDMLLVESEIRESLRETVVHNLSLSKNPKALESSEEK